MVHMASMLLDCGLQRKTVDMIMDDLKDNMEQIKAGSRQRGGAVKMSRELMLVMRKLVRDGGAV